MATRPKKEDKRYCSTFALPSTEFRVGVVEFYIEDKKVLGIQWGKASEKVHIITYGTTNNKNYIDIDILIYSFMKHPIS